MTYSKKIDIQVLSVEFDKVRNEVKKWKSLNNQGFWSSVNGTGGREYYTARAVNSENDMTFRIRYTPLVSVYRYSTEKIRIVYNCEVFDVVHIDDYQEQHRELVIKAKSNQKRED